MLIKMKKKLGIWLPATAVSLFFAQSAFGVEEHISGLMFIPKANVFYGNTYVQYLRSSFDLRDSEVTGQNTTLNQEIGFGFTDRLSAKVMASTIISDETKIKTNSVNSTQENESLREPEFEFKYRFDSVFPWASKFDMDLSYSPRIKDAKTANGNFKGLSYRGNHKVGATATLGHELTSTRSWKTSLEVNYFTKTVSELRNAPVPSPLTYTDKTIRGTLSFVWQEMFREDLGLNVGGHLSYNSDIDKTSQTTGFISNEEAFYSLGVSAQGFWTYKNKIKYYGEVGLEKASDRNIKSVSATDEINSQWNSQAILGAKYLF